MQVEISRRTDPSVQSGISMVDEALNMVLVEQGSVTPSIEARIQHALDLLRRASGAAAELQRAERISTMLFGMALSKVNGRTNLHHSQLLRLSRFAS